MAVSHPYYDLHCDTLYTAWKKEISDIFQVPGAMADVSKLRQGGCRLQLCAIFMPPPAETQNPAFRYPGDDAYIEALRNIFLHTVQTHRDIFAAACSMEDISRNAEAGKVSGMLSMEDGRAVQGNFDHLQRFYEMGIRVLGLTWNQENCFGFPNSSKPEEMVKGLTNFGKDAVPYMESLGMLIDVSHLSDGGFRDVAMLCRGPFIASHSNCRALNPHPRSMTDEMIRTLADHGGIMGLNFCPAFLTRDLKQKDATVDALARQLRHRIRIGGLECAAIGTDFDGIGGDLEIASAGHMPEFFDALLHRGFTPLELEYISHRNAERVFQEVIG